MNTKHQLLLELFGVGFWVEVVAMCLGRLYNFEH